MATTAAPVTVDSSATDILASLSPEQTAEWRKSGKLPDLPEAPPKEKAETAPAESSPAAKETPAPAPEKVAAEAPAESAPAAVEPKAKGAEARIKELLAQNKAYASELETLRKAPVAAPAKIEEPAKPHRNDVDAKTGQFLYATDEAFEEARDAWLTQKVTQDVRKQYAKEAQEKFVAEQNKLLEKRWSNSLKIAREKYPDYDAALQINENGSFEHPELKAIKANSVLDGAILESEVGGELLYYLGTHPGEVERIQSLGAFASHREVIRLEDKLAAPATIPVKEEKKAEGSQAPVVTKAPAPATNVSGKATAPVDEVEAALKDGNFRTYKAAADRDDVQKRKASK